MVVGGAWGEGRPSRNGPTPQPWGLGPPLGPGGGPGHRRKHGPGTSARGVWRGGKCDSYIHVHTYIFIYTLHIYIYDTDDSEIIYEDMTR